MRTNLSVPCRRMSVALLVLACIAPPVVADIATLTPSKDNTLYEDENGLLSNGAGDFLFTGRTNQDFTVARRRALLAFDVAGSVPAGSTVIAATLVLNISNTFNTNPRSVSVHRVLADWGEGDSEASFPGGSGTLAQAGDATWTQRFFDPNTPTAWTNAGGDFQPTPSARTSVGSPGSYAWGPTEELASDVQGWLDAPSTNFGWLVVGEEGRAQTAKRIDSRDNDEEPNRPKLTVDFDLPGAPTRTATPTPTVTPTATASLTPTETATPQPVPNQPLQPVRSVLTMSVFLVAILVLSRRKSIGASRG